MAERRGFRSTAALLVAALALASAPVRAAGHRNVILMIADGFGPQHFAATLLYSERVRGRQLCMSELMRRGFTGYVLNDAVDAVVAESAAAATQMATGKRAMARVLSMSPEPRPDGTPYRTILELAQGRGMSTGLVTTAGVTDATPGAFAAHVLDRGREDAVAEQELARRVDVLMGGRREFFLPRTARGSRRTDDRDLIAESQAAGYAAVQDAAGLGRVSGGRVLGLFSRGDMAYDRERAGTGQPSLAAMAGKALALLSQGGRGFFALIEGGRIDHAAHGRDVANVIGDALAFDDAVCAAMDFQRREPDTLLIVTSDHETGGLVLVPGGTEGVAIGAGEGLDQLRAVFSTGGHTASPVLVFGAGPGAKRLPGLHHNTELFEIMRDAVHGR